MSASPSPEPSPGPEPTPTLGGGRPPLKLRAEWRTVVDILLTPVIFLWWIAVVPVASNLAAITASVFRAARPDVEASAVADAPLTLLLIGLLGVAAMLPLSRRSLVRACTIVAGLGLALALALKLIASPHALVASLLPALAIVLALVGLVFLKRRTLGEQAEDEAVERAEGDEGWDDAET